MIIGITGNMGSGKSTLLSKTPYKVLIADDMVAKFHEKYQSEIFDIVGTNDKKEIFEIILIDKDIKKELEEFFYELISIKLTEFKYIYKDEIILFEAANMFELGLDEFVSKTIYIDTPKYKCFQNSKKKNKYSMKMIINILREQLSRKEFMEKSDLSFKTSKNMYKDIIRFNKFIDVLIGKK